METGVGWGRWLAIPVSGADVWHGPQGYQGRAVVLHFGVPAIVNNKES